MSSTSIGRRCRPGSRIDDEQQSQRGRRRQSLRRSEVWRSPSHGLHRRRAREPGRARGDRRPAGARRSLGAVVRRPGAAGDHRWPGGDRERRHLPHRRGRCADGTRRRARAIGGFEAIRQAGGLNPANSNAPEPLPADAGHDAATAPYTQGVMPLSTALRPMLAVGLLDGVVSVSRVNGRPAGPGAAGGGFRSGIHALLAIVQRRPGPIRWARRAVREGHGRRSTTC